MSIPFDLLDIALDGVGTQNFKLKRWKSRTISDNGLPVDTYETAINCVGQIQPADQATYEMLGLNFEKEVRIVWTSEKVSSLENDKHAPDLLLFEGKVWTVKSVMPWNYPNGWQQVTAIVAPQEQQYLYE